MPKTTPAPRDTKWFWDKIAKRQSNCMLVQLESHPFPENVDPKEVLDACLKEVESGCYHVTTVDEKILLRFLGDESLRGRFHDEDLRDVLVHASPFAVIKLHRMRPDLLPAERVKDHIEEEAFKLIENHFKRPGGDKRLSAFIRSLEGIPGFAEVIAVHHLHGN